MIKKEYVASYIRSLYPTHEGILKELEVYALENHVPIVEREVAQLLKVLLKIYKPKRILEIGTAIGYSAILMASSTEDSCTIETIERRLDMVDLAKENIKKAKYDHRIRIHYGEAESILKDLEDKYDFIFLDAAKGQYLDFFNDCVKLLNIGGIIVSDNVLYKGMVASDKLVVRRKKTIVKRLRQYLKYINELENFETCVIPIGDGVSITYREE
ncbi:MAG: O-methyltransferase [Tissierellia bacterium]|nr:O-methyltransferase [Tissierellia bacterium]